MSESNDEGRKEEGNRRKAHFSIQKIDWRSFENQLG